MNRRNVLAGFTIGAPWLSAELVHDSGINFTVEGRLKTMVFKLQRQAAKLQDVAIQAEAERAAAAAEAERLKEELTAAQQEIETWKTIVRDYSEYNAALEDNLFITRGER